MSANLETPCCKVRWETDQPYVSKDVPLKLDVAKRLGFNVYCSQCKKTLEEICAR